MVRRRDHVITALYATGTCSFRGIAKLYDLSHETVRQIVLRHGMKPNKRGWNEVRRAQTINARDAAEAVRRLG